MKKILLPVILLLLLLVRVEGAAPAEPKTSESPAAALDWLVGGKWTATLPDDKDSNSVSLELVVNRPENQQGLQYNSAFIVGGKRRPYTSGMYAWDGAKKQFAMFYTDSNGSVSFGEVRMEDGVFVHEFTATGPDGIVEHIRVRLTKASPTVFTNEIYVQQGSTWAKVVSVRYERSKLGGAN